MEELGLPAHAEVIHDCDGQAVRFRGRLDVRSVADLRMTLHGAIAEGSGPLTLDFAHAQIGDATALGMLVEAHRRCRRQGRSMRLVNVCERCGRLLRAVHLHAEHAVVSA